MNAQCEKWYEELEKNKNQSFIDNPHPDDNKFFKSLTHSIETNIMAHGLQRLRNKQIVAQGKKQINNDYDMALAMLHNLCAKNFDNESLRLFRDAITKQAYKIPTREKPLFNREYHSLYA